MPKLIIQQPDREWSVELQNGANVMGRSSKCTIPVGDTNISREHCEFFVSDRGVTLIDKGSMNGTLLNGQRVWEQKLQSGDRVQIGQTVIWFEVKESDTPAPKSETPPRLVPEETKAKTQRATKPPSGSGTPAVTVKKSEAKRSVASLVKDYAAWARPSVQWMRILPYVGGAVALGILVWVLRGAFGGKSGPPEDRENLLQDDVGFESSPAGKAANWTVHPFGASSAAVADGVSHWGKRSLELNKSDASDDSLLEAECSTKIALSGFSAFEVSAWTKWSSFTGAIALKATWLSAGVPLFGEYSEPHPRGADWAQVRGLFPAPPGADALRISLCAVGLGRGQVHIDDVRVVGKDGGGPPRGRTELGSFHALVSRGGALAIGLGAKPVMSDVHVRLENSREGTASQLFSSPTFTSESQRLLLEGKMSHPVGGGPVPYSMSAYFDKEGELTLVYEFKGTDLRQVDRVVVTAIVPRADRLRIAAEPVSRLEFGAEGEKYQLDYPENIRPVLKEGRLVQPFEVREGEATFRAGFRIRAVSDRDERQDPRIAANRIVAAQPGKALAMLRAAQNESGIEDAAARDIASTVQRLEGREAAEWREAESRVLVAEAIGTAHPVESAVAELDKYKSRWSGEPYESKARSLQTRLSAVSPSGGDSPRSRMLLERAQECLDQGRRAMAESILAGIIAAYGGTEVAEEAQRMLDRLRSGG